MKTSLDVRPTKLRLSLLGVATCFALYGCSFGGQQTTSNRSTPKALDANAKKDKKETKKSDDLEKQQKEESSGVGQEPLAIEQGSVATGDQGGGIAGGSDAGADGSADASGEDPTPEPTKEVARLTSSVGIKNFVQINATMSALTSVPTTNAVVAPVFTQLATQLPDGNDIRAFLPSHQVAIGKLAVEYCDVMVNTPEAVAQILPGIALNVAPATALNATGRDAINTALISRFWGAGMADVPAMGDSLAVLSKLTDELLAGKDVNSAALTPSVVKGLCTAVLASGPVTFQ